MPNDQAAPRGRGRLRAGGTFGKWTLVDFVGRGGNGEVWFAESGDELSAVKVLHRTAANDYERFRREVKTCKEIDSTAIAILPVIDDYLPANLTKNDRAWYAMPRALPLASELAGANLEEKVEAVREVTTTLAVLAEKHGLHHRDVKPENLFKHDARVVVGDFGCVKGPGDADLTNPDNPVGPIHHLAPELAVGDENPDLERVDVYYLAQTLWRLALERDRPPRGHIRADEEDSLARRLPEEPQIAQLAQLIARATERAPGARPGLRDFAAQLQEWLGSRSRAVEILAEHQRYASLYEVREIRNRAVLQWIVNHVRAEPVFNAFGYEIPGLDEPNPDVPGLTEGQMAEALTDLIDEGLVSGEPHLVFGRREPRHFTHLYPTLKGIGDLHDLDDMLLQAAPLLRAFIDPADHISLSRSTEPMEITPGVVKTPPEAYFEMWLLAQFDFLDYGQLAETGGHATFTNVRATSQGRRWLYDIGSEGDPERPPARRQTAAPEPHVFPAPDGDWGNDAGPLAGTWRRTLPVTNGGHAAALNVMARLIWPPPSGTQVQTVPTSVAPGASTILTIDWAVHPVEDWKALKGLITYNAPDNALWETTFRIHGLGRRYTIEVTGFQMIKLPDGTVIA